MCLKKNFIKRTGFVTNILHISRTKNLEKPGKKLQFHATNISVMGYDRKQDTCTHVPSCTKMWISLFYLLHNLSHCYFVASYGSIDFFSWLTRIAQQETRKVDGFPNPFVKVFHVFHTEASRLTWWAYPATVLLSLQIFFVAN